MKSQYLLLFLVFSTFNSCKEDVPLVFSSESFTEDSLDICKSIGCPDISINYLKAAGTSRVSEKINSEINAFIISSLALGEDSMPKANTIAEAASEFIKTYRMHSADFPDMAAEYFAEIDVSETYRSEEVITLELRQYLFTGGAHGYGNTSFLNINPETGITIPIEALFNNNEDFTSYCENKFREKYQIPPGASINSTGFWFEDDMFYIPNTIGFINESLILVYNSYEIASYAEGPVELEIPIEVIGDLLNVK